LPLLTVVDNEVYDLEGEGWDNSLDINILWLVSLHHAFSHCTAPSANLPTGFPIKIIHGYRFRIVQSIYIDDAANLDTIMPGMSVIEKANYLTSYSHCEDTHR
jgi:hypothetical protein